MTRAAQSVVGIVALALTAGCATAPASPDDPFEPANRVLFDVHETADKYVLKPMIDVYTFILPKPVRTGVSNFFNNIDDLFSGVNALLQGKPDKAGNDFGRVMLNTFVLGGIFDVASDLGIERGGEDFGQTFGVWGFPQGPYLFVPLFGPTTVRDGTGWLVRLYTGPVGFIPDVPVRNTIYGVGAVDLRYQVGDALDIVDTAALDKYTFIRNAYLQRRRYLVYDGQPPPDKEE
jgi:phospholipid-binding lipoprotein MlaA